MSGKQILVTASISVTVLGLICGVVVFAIKSVRRKDDREKTSKNNNPQTPANKAEKIDITSVAHANIPEGILEDEYESADALLKDILYYFLSKREYSNPEELLEKTIRACGQKIDDYSWYEKLPKNIEELESKIDEFEYGHVYRRELLEAQQNKRQ